MQNFYIINPKTAAVAHRLMNNSTVKRLWKSFCLEDGEIEIKPCEEFIFKIGDPGIAELKAESEYVLSVSENGIFIKARDYSGLVHGFYALLMKINYNNGRFEIHFTKEYGDFLIKNRMIHICVFPEDSLYFIKKLIRFSALCGYTHIVIEFWGMLKYDCLKELAWPQAFTKDEAGALITECRELGLEPIPMFNQLGHASASRVCYGKHVVLDQNPRLQKYFTPDGWVWNIQSDETAELLKHVRAELYELFGTGEYIHLGFDEAYFISHNPFLRKKLPEYIAGLTAAAENEGRRPMIWMDMLLEENSFKDCYTVGNSAETAKLRAAASPSTVFIDWQYNCRTAPVPSLLSLKNCGHDCIGAPWLDKDNYTAHINTVAENKMFGLMLTTWHTLRENMPGILGCAEKCGAHTFEWGKEILTYEKTATLLRRVSFEGNTYEAAGWSKSQIEI